MAPKKQKKEDKKPSSDIFLAKSGPEMKSTLFKMYYDRGDLPLSIDFSGAERKIKWKVEPELLDYQTYLSIFFEGLRETEDPYRFLADKGTD